MEQSVDKTILVQVTGCFVVSYVLNAKPNVLPIRLDIINGQYHEGCELVPALPRSQTELT